MCTWVSAQLVVLVHMDLDVGKELRCILHLIDQHRRLVKLQEHLWISFCEAALVQI